ncbi:hypothetical protein RYX36_035210, partial [Vicia faba]
MVSFNTIWIFSLALLLTTSPFLQVVRCQSESGGAVETTESDIGIVVDDAQDFDSVGTFSAAPGIDTISVFPKNIAKLVTVGDDTELLVGVKNDGESSLNVVAIKASINLPVDHRLLVQNLTAQVFNNGSVPASALSSLVPPHISTDLPSSQTYYASCPHQTNRHPPNH